MTKQELTAYRKRVSEQIEFRKNLVALDELWSKKVLEQMAAKYGTLNKKK